MGYSPWGSQKFRHDSAIHFHSVMVAHTQKNNPSGNENIMGESEGGMI